MTKVRSFAVTGSQFYVRSCGSSCRGQALAAARERQVSISVYVDGTSRARPCGKQSFEDVKLTRTLIPCSLPARCGHRGM